MTIYFAYRPTKPRMFIAYRGPDKRTVVNQTPETVSTLAVVVGPPGKAGTPGADGALKTYTHTQVAASAVWVISHNLGLRPNVQITDSAGTVLFGDINHPTNNQTIITFGAGFSGSARLN